jgi:hypothetical protein
MPTKEKHNAWRPKECPSGEMNVRSVTSDADGLRIRLQSWPPSGSEDVLEIRFERFHAYRVIDEGDRVGQHFQPDQQCLV